MGVNDAYRLVPDLDYLYAPDESWVAHHENDVKRCQARKFTAYSKDSKQFDGWEALPWKDQPGLSTNPAYFHTGCHSGLGLINIAYQLGCRLLILIGYDGRGGGQHFFGPHPRDLYVETNYEKHNKRHASVAADSRALGLTIINATPGSAINAHRRMSLAEAIEYHRLHRNRAERHAATG